MVGRPFGIGNINSQNVYFKETEVEEPLKNTEKTGLGEGHLLLGKRKLLKIP